jgi:hypothetical protein
MVFTGTYVLLQVLQECTLHTLEETEDGGVSLKLEVNCCFNYDVIKKCAEIVRSRVYIVDDREVKIWEEDTKVKKLKFTKKWIWGVFKRAHMRYFNVNRLEYLPANRIIIHSVSSFLIVSLRTPPVFLRRRRITTSLKKRPSVEEIRTTMKEWQTLVDKNNLQPWQIWNEGMQCLRLFNFS